MAWVPRGMAGIGTIVIGFHDPDSFPSMPAGILAVPARADDVEQGMGPALAARQASPGETTAASAFCWQTAIMPAFGSARRG